ncbi:MAG: YitT family protein [Marinifilaceae bacterium]|nr:YitT family protein [Marinifilaceae bacterium]
MGSAKTEVKVFTKQFWKEFFKSPEKPFSRDFFMSYAWLIGGCFVFALGAVLFAEPYGFAPGGTYGLSMVFHHLWGWETEVAAFCMDVPLLLLGIYFLGGMFGIKTLICTFAIPAFMWLIHETYGYAALLEPEVVERTELQEQLLSAIFGGIVYGIGIGMIFKARATSGGSDIISMILNKYTHISLGTLVIIVDCTITISTVIAFGDWRLPMYSWIIVFIEGKVIDLIVEGASVNKTLMIVSDHMEEVKDVILNEIHRGATIVPAIGAYKGVPHNMIYTILSRKEMMVLRHRIREIDPEAFINVIDSREILGRGFKPLED